MINMTTNGQSKLFARWKTMTLQHRTMYRCQLTTEFFYNTRNACDRTLTKILFPKRYDLNQINILHNYISKVVENTNDNCRIIINKMR